MPKRTAQQIGDGPAVGYLVAGLMIVAAFTWAGVLLIRVANRQRQPPGVPPARLGGPAPSRRGRLPFALGLALIAAPWVAVIAAIASLFGGHEKLMDSKGRVLRIKNHAVLPALARGDAGAPRPSPSRPRPRPPSAPSSPSSDC